MMSRHLYVVFGMLLCIYSCNSGTESRKDISEDNTFSFVFFTDSHLEYKGVSLKYFNQAIDTINKLEPDFVIAGGDLVFDTNNVRETYADSLYNLYLNEIRKFNMPVYSTIGNHEITGLGIKSDIHPVNQMYGKGMFEEKIGKRFYTFMHKGWKFFILDDLKVHESERRVVGHFDDEQLDWLRSELSKTDSLTPIAISCHIPIITTIKKFEYGSMSGTPDYSAVDNSMEFFELFNHKKLKLILQGHEHFLEVLYAMDMYFITGSSVSGGWKKPPDSRGMILLHIAGDELSWKFIENK